MENNIWNFIPKDTLYFRMKMAAYDALKVTYNKYKSKFDPRKQSRLQQHQVLFWFPLTSTDSEKIKRDDVSCTNVLDHNNLSRTLRLES